MCYRVVIPSTFKLEQLFLCTLVLLQKCIIHFLETKKIENALFKKNITYHVLVVGA